MDTSWSSRLYYKLRKNVNTINKMQETNLTIIETEVNPIIAKANSLTVSDETGKAEASQLLASLTLYLDRTVKDRETITKPMQASLNAVRAKYKPIETILSTSIDILRANIGKYQTEQLKLKKIKEDGIASRVGEGRGKLTEETAMRKIDALATPETKVIADNGTITFRTDRVLKVIDISLIPDEYFDLNESKLLKAMKAGLTVNGAILEEIQTVVTKKNK